jgi:hypothetical protein
MANVRRQVFGVDATYMYGFAHYRPENCTLIDPAELP